MKKRFIAISALLTAVVVTLLIVLGTVRKNVCLEYDAPSVIRIYNQSTNPIKNDGYTKDDEPYKVIIEKLTQMTNMTLMQRLNKLKNLKTNVYVDSAGTYNSYKSEMKKENLVIELDFSEEQDVVVYDDGNTRVVSYWCISYVITKLDDFTEIVVYYSTTNSSTAREESYAKCDPIILKGFTQDIVNYVNSL